MELQLLLVVWLLFHTPRWTADDLFNMSVETLGTTQDSWGLFWPSPASKQHVEKGITILLREDFKFHWSQPWSTNETSVRGCLWYQKVFNQALIEGYHTQHEQCNQKKRKYLDLSKLYYFTVRLPRILPYHTHFKVIIIDWTNPMKSLPWHHIVWINTMHNSS